MSKMDTARYRNLRNTGVESSLKELPETVLWRAVLAQAIVDARIDPQTYRYNSNLRKNDKELAAEFLLHDQRHFPVVCEAAGYDWRYVREKVRRAL